jgi:hypothetical protein
MAEVGQTAHDERTVAVRGNGPDGTMDAARRARERRTVVPSYEDYDLVARPRPIRLAAKKIASRVGAPTLMVATIFLLFQAAGMPGPVSALAHLSTDSSSGVVVLPGEAPVGVLPARAAAPAYVGERSAPLVPDRPRFAALKLRATRGRIPPARLTRSSLRAAERLAIARARRNPARRHRGSAVKAIAAPPEVPPVGSVPPVPGPG